MRSIIGLPDPVVRAKRSALTQITDIANAIQRIRSQSAQRQAQQQATKFSSQREPLQEALLKQKQLQAAQAIQSSKEREPYRLGLLQAQQRQKEFQLGHPLYGQAGPAGQIGAAQVAGEETPQGKLIEDMLRSDLESRTKLGQYRDILSQHAGMRRLPVLAKQQIFSELQEKGYPASVIASMPDSDRSNIIANNMSYSDYRGSKGLTAHPEEQEEAQRELGETRSKIAKATMTAKQLDSQRIVPAAINMVEGLRDKSRQLGSYMGIKGIANLKGDQLKAALGGKASPAYIAWTNYMAQQGAAISKIRGAFGGQATDYETKLLNRLIPKNFWNMTPDMVESTFNELLNALGHQRNLLKNNISQNLKYDPFRDAHLRSGSQASSYAPTHPEFKSREEAIAWYKKMIKENPDMARSFYEHSR